MIQPTRATGALLLAILLAAAPPAPARDPAAAIEEIDAKELEQHLRALAAPGMEGRDSPSEGLSRAADYIIARFREAGLEHAPDSVEALRGKPARDMEPAPGEEGGPAVEEGRTVAQKRGTYLRPYELRLEAPKAEDCSLMMLDDGAVTREFRYGEDYVPLSYCPGSARGELVFCGFGIRDKREKYDDLKGLRLDGKVALILEGEPRHKKRFEGEEVTVAASVWRKLEELADAGVVGVLVVRRAPEGGEEDPDNRLDYRYTFAQFPGERNPRPPRERPPVLEISMECASALLDEDVEKLAASIDRSGRPKKVKEPRGRVVSLDSALEQQPVRIDNLVGLLPGSDPELADEYVVLGAHYDHIGVDSRGRVGPGADDNGSGTATLLEIVEALAAGRPRRSVLVCAFSSEEDGLVGSKRLCEDLPVQADSIVAMVNLDMVGRGDVDEVAVLGTRQNPGLLEVLKRAERLAKTGVKHVVTGKGEELFQRSDHFSFHELGVPALFFFEGLPIERNKDYHTWRDVVDAVDFEKCARTGKLAFNTIWILANDDERPDRPKH